MSKILPFLFVLAVFVQVSPVYADQTPWAQADQMRARLLSGGGKAAIEIELSKGWHSYWHAPGDAGLAPTFTWDGSENVENVDVQWPYPQRFDEMGIVTFGYEGNVIFPVTVKKTAEGTPTKLNLVLDIMVCADICIPQQLKMFTDLTDKPQPQTAIIDAARKRVPKTGSNIVIETMVAGPDALVITANSPRGFDKADVFTTVGDVAVTYKPEITLDAKDPRKAMIRIPMGANVPSVDGKDVTVVVVSGNEAGEKTVKF